MAARPSPKAAMPKKKSAPAQSGESAGGAAKKSATTAKKSSTPSKAPGTNIVGERKTSPRPASKRKYSRSAAADVGTELHEMHEGTLTSGRNGKKVTDPKQAIAIGLSEARRAGKKVPPNPSAPAQKSKKK